MKKIRIISFILLLFFSLTVSSSLVLAQSYSFNENSGLNSAATGAGYVTTEAKTIEYYISQVITIILSVLGVIFLALMIYGGLIWMTATGNEERVKKAKELITEATIGLVIILAAYAISYFILNQLVSASLVSGTISTSTPTP